MTHEQAKIIQTYAFNRIVEVERGNLVGPNMWAVSFTVEFNLNRRQTATVKDFFRQIDLYAVDSMREAYPLPEWRTWKVFEPDVEDFRFLPAEVAGQVKAIVKTTATEINA